MQLQGILHYTWELKQLNFRISIWEKDTIPIVHHYKHQHACPADFMNNRTTFPGLKLPISSCALETGLVQSWEHSPPTNLAWMYVGWDCCWFLLWSEGFSPASPVFLPPQKLASPNSNSDRMKTSWYGLLAIYCDLFIYVLLEFTNNLLTYPIPQLVQHETKSSAEIWGVSLPLDEIQILSVMASTAPNAWKNIT